MGSKPLAHEALQVPPKTTPVHVCLTAGEEKNASVESSLQGLGLHVKVELLNVMSALQTAGVAADALSKPGSHSGVHCWPVTIPWQAEALSPVPEG